MEKEIEYQYYTWEMFDIDVKSFKRLYEGKYPNKNIYIVGLFRGGLPFATALSNTLDVEMGILKFQSYGNKNDKEVKEILFEPKENDKIVIVDDIYDTGNTFTKTQEWLESKGIKDADYIALISSEVHSPKFKHDSFNSKINDSWVIFPWE